MTVKKLTDADRKEILDLYRHTGETTSTLADRYGVSNSTISRFLKVTLPEDEYETLIAAKRAARTPGGEEKSKPQLAEPEPAAHTPSGEEKPKPQVIEPPAAATAHQVQESPIPETPAVETPSKVVKRRRIITQTPQETETPVKVVGAGVTNNNIDTQDISKTPQLSQEVPSTTPDSLKNAIAEDVREQANTIAQMLGEDLLDRLEDDDDLDDDLDDLDDDFDDLDDEDEDDQEDEQPIIRRRLPADTFIQVLPLSEAMLPKTCYLVIDRTAELITRPLRDFGDLGQIPSQEFQQRTLPVFDNHRVARRFSSKRDRVIKVPDSRMFQKARPHLQAKGITRLLFDGRVYSLSPV